MRLPPPPIASAGKASARARLVVARAGAAPARARAGTVAAALRPSSLPFAAAGGRFAGGGVHGGGERGGGGASRLAGAAVYTALRRPAAPVLCLAHRAGGEGDGYPGAGAGGEGGGDNGAGAGGDEHGGGGVGAGGDEDYNAKKDWALNHGKAAPAGGGRGAGDDCAKKDCTTFDHGKGKDGAPAGGGGGAGAGGDQGNAEKAGNFAKGTCAAAAGGGGGGDRADQACWRERMSLRWVLIQGLISAALLGLSAYVAFKLWFDTMVKKLVANLLKDEELRMLVADTMVKKLSAKLLKDEELKMLMADAVKSVSYHATEPMDPKLWWKMSSCSTKKFYVCCGVFACLYFFVR